MKLNPKKCVFGVTSGKFFGYLVSHRGIEANPDKVKAIQDMSPPRNIREIQRLNVRLAALNRFLSQSAEKALPFFKVLKKADQFAWTEECQAAFDKLKQYLHHLPTLASPRPEEKFYLYLSAADEAVSAVLIRDEGTQVPVYYVSRALRGPEIRYTQVEKLVIGLVHAARRLKPYFLAHPISVRTDQPIQQILVRPEASGRLTKWAVELGDRLPRRVDLHGRSRVHLRQCRGVHPTPWTLYVDGSSNGDGYGAGLLLEGPQGEVCSYALRFGFPATNNEDEYKALIAGLQLARRLGAQQIHVRSDSQQVVRQVLGEYETKEETMQRYLSKVHQLTAYFESFEIQKIPRSHNKRADALSRLASTSFSDLNKTVLVEVLNEPGYMEEVAYPVHSEDIWMTPFILFLGQGTLPEDRAEARKIQTQGCSTRLHRVGSSWVEELPSVLWSYRTTPRSATQETPFSLTYGAEAVIPAEILTPNTRLAAYAAEVNDKKRQLGLDLVEERMDLASTRIASYKNTLAHYYNARVRHRRFQSGDLVLRKNSISRAEPQGKLCPKWEDPYRVVESDLKRYCKLSYRDGSLVPRS
ncbi:uncharacterized protein [Coffea arabica]|uniref:RNase H type-1 domain-containing protein n=1 Tax=Coffea arabica TaxID=13443 RepID=A0A6P6TDW9_COFAR